MHLYYTNNQILLPSQAQVAQLTDKAHRYSAAVKKTLVQLDSKCVKLGPDLLKDVGAVDRTRWRIEDK